VTKIRKMYERIISEKHEDTMAKFGAIIAQGIIDAGTPGRPQRRARHHVARPLLTPRGPPFAARLPQAGET